MPAVSCPQRSGAVVEDLERQPLGVTDPDGDLAGSGVLDRVGQCFLDDPVGGDVDAGRERPRFALDRQPHR